jgi:hypothetical protein
MKKIRWGTAVLSLLFLAMAIPAGAADLTPRAELNGAEEYALARFCAAETEGEPFICRLSVAAVMLNRMEDPRFPDTVTGILFDGGYKASPVTESDMASARWALQVAQMGVDPTGGALWWAWSDTADAADLIPKLTVGKRVFGVRAKEVGGGQTRPLFAKRVHTPKNLS